MLSKCTTPNRTFSFLINGKTIEKKSNENVAKKTPFTNFNKYKPKNPDEPEPFILKDEDFPPLC